MSEAGSGWPTDRRRLIINPVSGAADHRQEVRLLADHHGFSVVETERQGHAADLATQAAAEGVGLLAVCGGDGTVHEAVQGLFAADALGSVTLSVIPAGTENILAETLGIDTMGEGFEVAQQGATRRLDLGVVADEPFVMSAVAGLPAEVSDSTTAELKRRFGSAAFVLGGLKAGLTFDGLAVSIDPDADDGTAWRGEAVVVLVGNLRRFGSAGGQANAEDGLLDVEIIQDLPARTALREAIEQRLLGRETPHLRSFRTSRIEITPQGGEPIRFSLDGEFREFETVAFGLRPEALRIRVSAGYTPAP